jgi:hypothetical protein
MDPKTIPEDIYKLLDDDTHHEANEDNVQFIGEAFKDLLRSRLTKREEKSGEDVLRFSSLGKPDRQLWYDANDSDGKEKMGGKQFFKFLYGDCIELLLLFLTMEAGHKVVDQQKEVFEDGVPGHIDAVIDDVLVDVKSASPYGFQKFVSGAYVFDDPFGYIAQLAGYAHALDKDRAGWLVADKVSGEIAYVELDEAYIRGNKPDERISHLREVLRSDVPPPRCYDDQPEGKSGNRKLGVGCSYCGHKEKCWADSNGGKGLRKFYYSKGPVWLTNVAKEPKVEEAGAASAEESI